MKSTKIILLLSATLMLSACTGAGGIFESRTYGVRDSEWAYMSDTQRQVAKVNYLEQQRLAETYRIERELRRQREELAQVRYEQERFQQQQAEHARNQAYAQAQERHNAQITRSNNLRLQQQQEHARIQAQQAQAIAAQQRALQEHASQQRNQEQVAIAEAQRRSLITQREEAARRQQLQQQEQRDIEEAMRRSMETYNQEQAARNAASAPAASNWQPNEGHLVRGGQLVMDLQRELGRQPSVNEMQGRLQSQMGLSGTQAYSILSELGLA